MSSRLRLGMECSLAALGAAGAAFLLLDGLYAELSSTPVHGFDMRIQAWVHSGSTPVATYVMRGLTFVGSNAVFLPTLAIGVCLLLVSGGKRQGRRSARKREVAAIFALGLGGAFGLNEAFKLHFHRARPAVPWAIGHESTFSFPSGHALFSSVLYGLIAYFILDRRAPLERRGAVALVMGLMTLGIGFSRVYLGMHWPTDVLAGYVTGGLWLSAAIFIDRRARTHRQRESTGG